MVDSAWILLAHEIAAVITALKQRSRKSLNARTNLTLFRLSCCCGLRCCELCGLNMDDVVLDGPRPVLRVRAATSKGGKRNRRGRNVDLRQDRGTLADLKRWHRLRLQHGAGAKDPFLCSLLPSSTGVRLNRDLCFKRWRTAIKALGPTRQRQVSVHKGRHAYATHSLNAGIPLLKVMKNCGHKSPEVTMHYLHVLDEPTATDVFDRMILKTELGHEIH